MTSDIVTKYTIIEKENRILKSEIEQLKAKMQELSKEQNDNKEVSSLKKIKMFSSLIQEGFGSDKYKSSDEVVFDYSNVSENFAEPKKEVVKDSFEPKNTLRFEDGEELQIPKSNIQSAKLYID